MNRRIAVSASFLIAAMLFVGAGCAKRAMPSPQPVPPSPVVPSVPEAVAPSANDAMIDAEVDRLIEAVDGENSALGEESADADAINADADAVSSFTDSPYVE